MAGSLRQSSSWREEMRQDRLISAQIDREREAARLQARIAERQARVQARREEDLARSAARRQAREQRAARRADRVAWVRGHVLDLLFVPVIVVPAVLAWTAMGSYGYQLYGPPGLLLPAFSEGAMWAFAIATTLTVRRHPDRPVWHLRLGTWVFAAVGAALNFTHGVTALPGPHALNGVGVGLVMALVSVAGVVAHQLITAGPRRSRAERDEARIQRAAARRELAARRAAVRCAVADQDGDGHARLIYEPGTVAVTGRHGRTRLHGRAGRAEALEAAADVVPVALSGTPDDTTDVALPAAPDDVTVSGQPGMPAATRRRGTRDTTRQKRRTQADIEAEALAVLSRQPRISGAELGRSVGVSGRTGQRLLTRLTRETASTDDT
jgi:hypothetical protein